MADVKRDSNWTPGMLAETDDGNRTPTPLKVDPTTGRLKIDSNSADGAASPGNGTITVATAGTAVQLSATSIPCKRVFVQSHQSNGDLANGGLIVVGVSDVVAALAGRKGVAFFPTIGDWFGVSNLNLLYIDAMDNGAKVHYFYEA